MARAYGNGNRTYSDEKTRGDIPDLDEHREKILKELH